MAKTIAQLQKEFKQRKKNEGYVEVRVWVRKEDKEKVKKYAKELN